MEFLFVIGMCLLIVINLIAIFEYIFTGEIYVYINYLNYLNKLYEFIKS